MIVRKKVSVSSASLRLEWIAGIAFFISFIAMDFIFGANAAVKVIGVACIVTGIVWIIKGFIGVGVEGRAPSFYIVGWAPRVIGALIIAIGVGILLYANLAACLLGWASECG